MTLVRLTPSLLVAWIVPPDAATAPLPVTAKVPPVFASRMPFVPPVAEALSSVTARVPVLMLTAAPAEASTAALLTVRVPTLLPTRPELALTSRPRSVLPLARVTPAPPAFPIDGRVPAVTRVWPPTTRATPCPISCWLASSTMPPL